MSVLSTLVALALMTTLVPTAGASGWKSKDQQTIEWRRAMLAALASIDTHLQELNARRQDQQSLKTPKAKKDLKKR